MVRVLEIFILSFWRGDNPRKRGKMGMKHQKWPQCQRITDVCVWVQIGILEFWTNYLFVSKSSDSQENEKYKKYIWAVYDQYRWCLFIYFSVVPLWPPPSSWHSLWCAPPVWCHCAFLVASLWDHIWELPGNYPVFTVVMVVYHYVERTGIILVTTNFLINIYDHEKHYPVDQVINIYKHS